MLVKMNAQLVAKALLNLLITTEQTDEVVEEIGVMLATITQPEPSDATA